METHTILPVVRDALTTVDLLLSSGCHCYGDDQICCATTSSSSRPSMSSVSLLISSRRELAGDEVSTSQRPLSFQVEARRRFEIKEGNRNSSSEIMTTSEINQQRPGLLYRNTNGLEVHQGGEAVQLSMHRRFGKRVDTKANFVTFRSHMHNSFLPIPSNVFVYGEIRDAKRRRDGAENIKVRCCSPSFISFSFSTI